VTAVAIPTIEPYQLPDADELPATVVSWLLDPRRAALLIHDMQRYFLAAFAHGEPPLDPVLANIAALRVRAAAAGVPVLYTAQPGSQAPGDRSLLTDFWGGGLDDDPEQTSIIDRLEPVSGEPVLTKWRYSAFQRTDLDERLRASGRDQLLVTGVYAHIGCQVTACEAFQRDIQPFLVGDAVADFSRAEHDGALRWVAGRCGRVLTTAQALTELDG
jgi:bifunctional isochorismate lyase / aryl carrier protein